MNELETRVLADVVAYIRARDEYMAHDGEDEAEETRLRNQYLKHQVNLLVEGRVYAETIK